MMGVQLSTTVPVKLFTGVMVRVYDAGAPLATVADAVLEPDAVRVNDPARVPLPVSGTAAGEVGSELVTVRVPARGPAAVGEKAMVTEQLAPAASVVNTQGVAMA